MRSYLKKVDAFGMPVTLTHQGNDDYRTTTGSLMTLVLLEVVLSYFGMKLIDLLTQSGD